MLTKQIGTALTGLKKYLRTLYFLVIPVVTFSLLLSSATGAEEPANTPWQALSPDMQTLLGEYKKEWQTLPAPKQQQLLQSGQRWLSFPKERRNVLWNRFQRWQAMSQESRMTMQQTYDRFKHLSPQDRQNLIKTHQLFKKMSSEMQQKMMQRFHNFQHRGGQAMPGFGGKMDMNRGDMSGIMPMPGMMK